MEKIILIILFILVIILLAHLHNEQRKLNKWFQLEEYLQESERIRKEQIHKNRVLK